MKDVSNFVTGKIPKSRKTDYTKKEKNPAGKLPVLGTGGATQTMERTEVTC